MKKQKKKILVTCALPYSNESIHIGHILEHIQADIWIRYQKMQNKNVIFICSDDSHGTAIMLKAKSLNIKPKTLIKNIKKEHIKNFKKFYINHDYYNSTHNNQNKKIVYSLYKKLKKKKLIIYKTITQLYDKKKKIFLPDRFIKGTCPKCQAKNQYGDNCEICGSVYSSNNIINPISIVSKTKPSTRKSKQIFFNLPIFQKILKKWIKKTKIQKQVKNKIKEWLKKKLKIWNISREAPYFGFKIPKHRNKYFYVWLDALICYISSFKNFCKIHKKIKFKDFWKKKSNTKLYHFIGKDIIYFHILFWPALLEVLEYRKPTNIFVHGHVKINNNKMSKSKKNFITANTYLKYLKPEFLRYYFATKISPKIKDINFNLYDLAKNFNSNIINKIINIASRISHFIINKFKGKLSKKITNMNLFKTFVSKSKIIIKLFNKMKFSKATKKILNLADLINQYINKKSPWIAIKNLKKHKNIHNQCSMIINLFKIVITILKPILPNLIKNIEIFLNTSITLKNISKPLVNHKINSFKKLYKYITKKQINKIIKKQKK